MLIIFIVETTRAAPASYICSTSVLFRTRFSRRRSYSTKERSGVSASRMEREESKVRLPL